MESGCDIGSTRARHEDVTIFVDRTFRVRTVQEQRSSIKHNLDAVEVIAGGVNSNVRMSGPLESRCFVRGEGSKLFDIDGNEYIDYTLGMGPAIFGHAPAFLTDAVAASLAVGQVFAGQHPMEVELARRLRQRVPCAELVRIGCTGSEMIQAAIRVARAYTGRNTIVKFEGHYHGWFDSVLVNHAGVAHDPHGQIPFPVQLPSEGQSRLAAQDTRVLPWNDIAVLSQFLSEHGSAIAAIIMEPVMCNVGVIPPRQDYLRSVRDLCDRHGIVLILDEVITGFRLRAGGAQEEFGVRPDLAIFAKALGGGFPVAALAGRADMMSLIASGRVNHSGTYNANTVSLAAGIASLDHLAAEGGRAYRQIEDTGTRLMRGIVEIASRRGTNLKVSGYPSVFHTFFSDQSETFDYFSYRKSDALRQRRFIESLPARGVRPMTRGTWFLSTSHTTEDVERTLQAVDESLADL